MPKTIKQLEPIQVINYTKIAETESEITLQKHIPITESSAVLVNSDGKTLDDVIEELSNVSSVAIINDLSSTSETDGLSAKMGKVLKESLDELTDTIGTLNYVLEARLNGEL